MLLRQLSNAIKTQLKAPKAPYLGHFLPFAGSLWHKGDSMQRQDLLLATNEHAELCS